MRILMSGGGTGGHVNPAIAIANIIKQKQPDSEIAFVGTPRGIENKLVPREGYELYHIDVRGLKRSLSAENIRALFLAATALGKARKLIKKFRPDMVIGTGGYVCWPIMRAAAAEGIPTVLHEANAIPGFAVKMLEKHVDLILINFEHTRERLINPDRAVRVGNPLKTDFSALSYEKAREELGIKGKYNYFLLSCGGSMGAERINEEVIRLMKEFTSQRPDILHVHATGAIEYEAAKKAYYDAGLDKYSNLELCEFIYDMPLRLSAADLVINRAGAITLSELAILGRACILIPSPNVTNNHQYKNAAELADKGAAVLIEEKELDGKNLICAVKELISDGEKRESMKKNIREFAITDANEMIYKEISRLYKEYEKKGKTKK